MNIHPKLPMSFPAGPGLFEDNAQHLSVRLLARMQAVPVRLMHAWSTPEYIDTWLTTPNGEEFRLCGSDKAAGRFSIDFKQWGRTVRSVSGEFRLVNPRSVRITWQLCTASGLAVTTLDISFKPRELETIVILRHSGFPNTDESLWHQALWQSSMARMQFLIR
jgi:uncharacterized protein YndB with AHSA1/START domain